MAQNSSIEWTDHTFNPWRGCTKVSAGCKLCYAETLSGRNPTVLGVWGKRGTRPIAVESYWKQAFKWNRDAERDGERRRVFCSSLADVFEGQDTMPASAHEAVESARTRLWTLIEATPMLDWLLLTKRPENILSMIPETWRATAPHNVWYGTSTENQEQADKRIPELLRVPAVVRFLSAEPLLGPVDLTFLLRRKDDECWYCHGPLNGEAGRCWCGVYHEPLIHWVIAGGESGHGARPMHPDWARSLRDQCVAAGVAFHFKQWGEYAPSSFRKTDLKNAISLYRDGSTSYVDVAHVMGFVMDGNVCMERIGKKTAGRLLDGRTWDEFPQPHTVLS